MSDFNPYNKWFGIPKNEASPSFYQILGLSFGESDPDVIESAAEQRLLFLKSVQNGPDGFDAKRLTNEVMIGRSTLLDPEKKAVYDSQLPSQKAISSVSQPPALSETASPSQPVSTRAKWTTASNKPTQPDLFRTEPTEPTHDQSSSADSRPGPVMPMPEHLVNRPIPQLPPSSKLPSKTNTTVDSQTSNNIPADNIVTTSAGSGVNITSTRRTYLKARGKNVTVQIAMFFVPTLLLIIFFTIFPQSFQNLVDGIREMAYGQDVTTDAKSQRQE